MVVLFSCAGVTIVATFLMARRSISQGLRFERMASEISRAASRVVPRPASD
jgi:hypothetical protein